MVQIKNLSKIVVAIDGSQKSTEAVEHGIAMAKRNKADLFVMNVIHTPATMLTYGSEKSFKEFLERSKGEAGKWFDMVRKHATEAGIPVKTDLIEEIYSVPGAIIKYAEEMEADVVVIGGTGRSGLKKFLLGSVSEDVVRYARCPVLVIK